MSKLIFLPIALVIFLPFISCGQVDDPLGDIKAKQLYGKWEQWSSFAFLPNGETAQHLGRVFIEISFSQDFDDPDQSQAYVYSTEEKSGALYKYTIMNNKIIFSNSDRSWSETIVGLYGTILVTIRKISDYYAVTTYQLKQ